MRHLYLIGYRGSGKTTVAQHLAAALGIPWVDADVLLEQRAGCSIEEIFRRHGEGHFRDLEEATLGELASGPPRIIALGGGAVLREANRQRLSASGACVWLDAPAATLAQRIAADATTATRRPSLTGQGAAEEVEQLLDQRRPLYEAAADLRLDTEGRTPQQLADAIAAWWAGRAAEA